MATDIHVAVDKILAATRPCSVSICDVRLQVFFRPGTGNSLLAVYNAAIPRAEARLPRYQPFLDVPDAQISIFDETLTEHQELTSGWYLGLPSWCLPVIVASLVRATGDRLGVRRRIHVGGSSGGFAALLLSWLDAGSVAVAVSPQTNLVTYQGPSAVKLLDLWPAVSDLESLGQLAPVDLRELHGSECRSSSIIIVSDGDVGHLHTQVLPFMSSIRAKDRRSVVMHVSYWGVPGHGRSVPAQAYLPWVLAAKHAPTLLADDIRASWRGLDAPVQQKVPDLQGRDQSRDLHLAALVGGHLSKGGQSA